MTPALPNLRLGTGYSLVFPSGGTPVGVYPPLATGVAAYFPLGPKAAMLLVSLTCVGLVARSGKLCVCCPEGYWRKGNVEVVCARYGVPLMETLAELIAWIRRVV